ncbi:MAG: radical SAM-associated putative lipoprotein [Prolixibacteraceae bacterium]|nr:radical SAM-associated putative lipoprotein [Prolixibacteraceae bacterium]MBN2773369.1 radical SAM-associated putative lipoprotein [Prolixibacteraceae bacterium]
MKSKLLKSTNIIISFFLSLLGFSTACDIIRYEYGSPHADYILSGEVKSAKTGQPVPQIKVKAGYDSTFTDNSGRYVITYVGFLMEDSLHVQFIDTDGATNNEYMPLDTVAFYSDADFSGGDGHWFKGTAYQELDVLLKEKE